MPLSVMVNAKGQQGPVVRLCLKHGSRGKVMQFGPCLPTTINAANLIDGHIADIDRQFIRINTVRAQVFV